MSGHSGTKASNFPSWIMRFATKAAAGHSKNEIAINTSAFFPNREIYSCWRKTFSQPQKIFSTDGNFTSTEKRKRKRLTRPMRKSRAVHFIRQSFESENSAHSWKTTAFKAFNDNKEFRADVEKTTKTTGHCFPLNWWSQNLRPHLCQRKHLEYLSVI